MIHAHLCAHAGRRRALQYLPVGEQPEEGDEGHRLAAVEAVVPTQAGHGRYEWANCEG